MKDDAISRREAIRIASGFCHPANVAKELAKLPAVQPQPEIVRCKDCKYHSHDAEYGRDWCNRTSGVLRVKPDDFCSRAERRTDETD